jgi:hypothetical protein
MNEATQIPEDSLKVGDKVAWLFGGYAFQGKVIDIVPVPAFSNRRLVSLATATERSHRQMREWDCIKREWSGNVYRMPHEAERLLRDATAIQDDLRNTIRLAESAIFSLKQSAAA